MRPERGIATSLVGSYPQPDWLIDREALRARLPPRVRARELWRVDPRWLLPRDIPHRKLEAMVAGAAILSSR
jgi:methionine synthase II (cobalamin-independent)